MKIRHLWLTLWTLVIFAFCEPALTDALSISLAGPRTELKEEHFDNPRYRTREGLLPKQKPRRVPTSEGPRSESTSAPAEQLKALPQLEEPSLALPEPGGGWGGLLLGGDLDDIREFKRQLDDTDLRKNSVEVSVAASWAHFQSSAASWGREAQSKGMGLGFEARYWISPLLGAVVSYDGNLSGTVQKQYGSDEGVPIAQRSLGVGMRSRRFFGSQKKIASLAWGLDARERTVRVAGESEKLNARSRAIFLVAEGRIPISKRWAVNLNVAIAPWVDHEETGGRAGDFSGVDVASTSYGLGLGLEYVFDRGNRLFLRAKGDAEANQFQRASGLVDPRTGQVSRGVSVSQSFMMLEFGYVWGH